MKIVVVAGVLYNFPTSQPQDLRRAMCSVCRGDVKRADGVLFHRGDSQWVRKVLFLFIPIPMHFLMAISVCEYACVCMCKTPSMRQHSLFR